MLIRTNIFEAECLPLDYSEEQMTAFNFTANVNGLDEDDSEQKCQPATVRAGDYLNFDFCDYYDGHDGNQ